MGVNSKAEAGEDPKSGIVTGGYIAPGNGTQGGSFNIMGALDYGNKNPINNFSGFTLNPAVNFNFPGGISRIGGMAGAQFQVGLWGFLPEAGANYNFDAGGSVSPTVAFALSKNIQDSEHTNVLSFELSGTLDVTREGVQSGAIGFSIVFGSSILHNITDKH